MATLQTATAKNPEAPGDTPPEARRRWRRYLLLVLLIPLVFYPLPFFLATSRGYEHWATSQWTPMLEYSYSNATPDADVVIFGDSSAFIGVDPRLVNRALGVRSVVLPDSIGSIPVTGDGPLQVYMAHHPAPRLLVLYFSPWNLDFNHIAKVRNFEGEEMMLRHESWREIMRFTLHHPTEMLVFPFRLYSTFGPKMVRAAMHHVNRQQETAEKLGHADYNGEFPPIKQPCTLPDEDVEAHGIGSVKALVERYNTAETHVMVYLAPIPDCLGSELVADRSYAALGAAQPDVLPSKVFASDPDYAHVLSPYVPETTALFERALKAELSRIR